MKRIIYTVLALVLISVSAYAGGPKRYVLGFYNVENLFDTYHDDGKNDYEFLPEGKNKWTEAKYEKKLHYGNQGDGRGEQDFPYCAGTQRDREQTRVGRPCEPA